MSRSFLLKTVLLVVALAVVLAVIVAGGAFYSSLQNGDAAAMRINSGGAEMQSGVTQTFFEQFVVGGGPIVWFVLLPMSLITVYLAAEYSLTIRRKKLLPRHIGRSIVETIRASTIRASTFHRNSQDGGEQQFVFKQLAAKFAEGSDFVSTAVVKALDQGRGDWFRMRNLLFESLQEQSWRLVRKIEWVNLIGNVSPMVGLFGTVFGMIKLFNAIVTAGGQPQPAQLAGGISVALVTTFWGLFIAIPAVAIHGVFANRIETLASDAVVEAENIIPELRRGAEKQKHTAEPKRQQPIKELDAKPVRTVDKSASSL